MILFVYHGSYGCQIIHLLLVYLTIAITNRQGATCNGMYNATSHGGAAGIALMSCMWPVDYLLCTPDLDVAILVLISVLNYACEPWPYYKFHFLLSLLALTSPISVALSFSLL